VQAADDATASSATVNEMRLLQLTDLPPVDHSRILGSAYRRQRRYRPLPAVPRVLQDDVKVSLSLSPGDFPRFTNVLSRSRPAPD